MIEFIWFRVEIFIEVIGRPRYYDLKTSLDNEFGIVSHNVITKSFVSKQVHSRIEAEGFITEIPRFDKVSTVLNPTMLP